MSSQHPTRPGSARVITREQRDALRREVCDFELHEPDFDRHLATPGAGVEARERWQRMTRAARLLDDLGWDVESDRDVYTLTMDRDDLERLIRHRLKDTEATLVDHAEAFAEIRAGKDPWSRPGDRRDERSMQAAVEDLREIADRDLEVVGACRAILVQLEDGSAALGAS